MLYFAIRNYRRYQHFKTRRPPWIKMYNDLLRDHEFACLPDAAKYHVVGLMLLASKCDNRIPGDPAYLARELHASSPIDLNALLDSGWLIHAAGRPRRPQTDGAVLTKMPAAQIGMTTGAKRTQLAIDLGPNNHFRDSNLCGTEASNIRNDLIEVDKRDTVHLAGTDHPPRGLSTHRAQQSPFDAAAEVAALRAARPSREKRKRADARSPAAAARGRATLREKRNGHGPPPVPDIAALRHRFPLASQALTPNASGDPIARLAARVPHVEPYLRVICSALGGQDTLTLTAAQVDRALQDWFDNAERPNIRKFRGYLRTAPPLPVLATSPTDWSAALARIRAEAEAEIAAQSAHFTAT